MILFVFNKKLNRDAIDLLSKLLDPNPITRPSAKESLGH